MLVLTKLSDALLNSKELKQKKNRQIRRQKEAAEAIRLNEIRAEQPPARDIWFLNPYIKRDWRVWGGVYLKDLTPKEVFIALTNAERDFELEGIEIPENYEYYHGGLKKLRDELAQDFKSTCAFHNSSLVVKTQSGYSLRYKNTNHDRYDFLIDLERIKEGVYYVKSEEDFKLNDELNLNSILRVPYYICDLEDEEYNLNLEHRKQYGFWGDLLEKHDDFRGCRFALNIKEGEDITQYSVQRHYVSNLPLVSNSVVLLLAVQEPNFLACPGIRQPKPAFCYLTKSGQVIGSLQSPMGDWFKDNCIIDEENAITCPFEFEDE